MDVSGILIIIFVLLCLSGAMVAFIFFFLNKRVEFNISLKRKDVEKNRAIKQTTFDTQEAERKRIGADLHDDIGPKLGILKMQLEMVGMKHPEVKETIRPVVKELIGTMKHVRKVSHDLVPQILFEMGLGASLKHISKQVNDMSGLSSTAYISDDLVELDKKKELAIYRVVQEGVNNALKHAHASRIDIHLDIVDNGIVVKVDDNGIGVQKNGANGLGLNSMKERAEVFNGVLEVVPGAENGTEVLLNLPI